ncbi:MAG: pilus assembly protein PilM [Anaerolineales bacterium]
MAKKVGTIDFDGRTIRLLISKSGKVLHWASATVSAQVMNQGLIVNPEEMAKEIQGLLGSKGVPRKRFVTSLTGHRTASRLITVPRVKTKFLDEAVRRKAKQEMPLPMDETYLSWQVLGVKNGQIKIYAFAVPKVVIDRQVETLKIAKLKPQAMDLKPLALARAVHDPNCIIANLEDQSAGVVLVVYGTPELIRSVPQTTEDASPQERVEKLAQELSRTVQFYDEGHRDTPLDPKTKVYATGLYLEAENIRELLAEHTPYEVVLPPPSIQVPEEFPVAAFSANLGLAMKSF